MKIRLPETLQKKLLQGQTITISPKHLSTLETHDYFSPEHTKVIVQNLKDGKTVRGTLNRADWMYLERIKNHALFPGTQFLKNASCWNRVRYIAHRGYTKNVKGNTEQAFRLAIKHGFTMLEIDLQMTKDKKIILYHDTIIQDRLFSKLTLRETLVLDRSILTLPKFLKKFCKKDTKIFLDVKAIDPKMVPILANNLQSYNKLNIFVFSFYIPMLQTIRHFLPTVHLGLATGNNFPQSTMEYLINEFHLSFFVVHWNMLTKTFVKNLHSHNQLVFAYTLQEDENKYHAIEKRLLALPIDGIITNEAP